MLKFLVVKLKIKSLKELSVKAIGIDLNSNNKTVIVSPYFYVFHLFLPIKN